MPLPRDEYNWRVAKVINHPKFASQPARIKCQLYKYLEKRHKYSSFDEHFKWACKAMENGAGYSKILNIYYDYLIQAKLTKELRFLENKFSYISKLRKKSPAVSNRKVKKTYDPKVKHLSPRATKKQKLPKEYPVIKEVEKLYAANGPKKYQELQAKLREKYFNSSLVMEYLRLLYLRDTIRQSKKKVMQLHRKSFRELYAKALTDYTCPDDAVNMFKFIHDKLRKEDKAYSYLETCVNNIADPSKTKLRIVYMLAKKIAKKDKAKASAIINKVNLATDDTSSGGALAFRVRMLSGFKRRLQKTKTN